MAEVHQHMAGMDQVDVAVPETVLTIRDLHAMDITARERIDIDEVRMVDFAPVQVRAQFDFRQLGLRGAQEEMQELAEEDAHGQGRGNIRHAV